MAELKQAMQLINQGKKQEAQSILAEILRSKPQDITAWFWYVETLDSLEKRVQVLEACLKQNPGNPQATGALEMLRAQQAPDNFVSAPAGSPPKNVSFSNFQKSGDMPQKAPYSDDPIESSSHHYVWDEDESKGKQPDPKFSNIDIQPNQKVLAWLESQNRSHEMILPFEYRLVGAPDPQTSDTLEHFMRQTSGFQNCLYVIYGYPAVVHPANGIIFGFQKFDSIYYRLPEKMAEEIDAYLNEVFSRAAGVKPRKRATGESSLSLEKNWVKWGSYFTPGLIGKCYDYNEGKPINLNIKEDIRKIFPTFFEKMKERLFNLTLVIAFLLAGALIVYAMSYIKEFLK